MQFQRVETISWWKKDGLDQKTKLDEDEYGSVQTATTNINKRSIIELILAIIIWALMAWGPTGLMTLYSNAKEEEAWNETISEPPNNDQFVYIETLTNCLSMVRYNRGKFFILGSHGYSVDADRWFPVTISRTLSPLPYCSGD